MVDDAEFMKRRHLSRGRPRKYEPNNSAAAAAAQQATSSQKLAEHVVTSSNVPTSLSAAVAQFKLAGGSQ